VSNGELLRSAESAGFDVMITTDQSIRYQQNLAGRKLPIVAIDTNDWTQIRNSKSAVLDALAGIAPGAYIEVEIPLR